MTLMGRPRARTAAQATAASAGASRISTVSPCSISVMGVPKVRSTPLSRPVMDMGK